MSRSRKVDLGFINIVIHPHSAELYQNLFEKAFDLSEKVKLMGDRFGYLGSAFPEGQAGKVIGIRGTILRFTEIDVNDKWLDLTTLEEADDTELMREIAIPDHLRPHFRQIPYFFDLKKHRIAFVRRGKMLGSDHESVFSPAMAQKYFGTLLNHPTLQKEFGVVDVTAEQSTAGLEKIFEIHRISTLRISIKRPNNIDDFEEIFEENLEEENVDEYKQESKSRSFDGIKPNERTKAIATLALRNGSVYGDGNTAKGKKVEYKTTEIPKIERTNYNPEKESIFDVLSRFLFK